MSLSQWRSARRWDLFVNLAGRDAALVNTKQQLTSRQHTWTREMVIMREPNQPSNLANSRLAKPLLNLPRCFSTLPLNYPILSYPILSQGHGKQRAVPRKTKTHNKYLQTLIRSFAAWRKNVGFAAQGANKLGEQPATNPVQTFPISTILLEVMMANTFI